MTSNREAWHAQAHSFSGNATATSWAKPGQHQTLHREVTNFPAHADNISLQCFSRPWADVSINVVRTALVAQDTATNLADS